MSSLNLQALKPDRPKHVSRLEYERWVELGVLRDQKVELIEGVIVEMSPQGTRHAAVIEELSEQLTLSLAGRARVRTQLPLAVGDDSEPEPDLAVVPRESHRRAHPKTAHLVVEVAQTSQRKDRSIKVALYARAGVEECWLVDLRARAVEVHRRPKAGRYAEVTRHDRTSQIALAAFPDVIVRLAPLLR